MTVMNVARTIDSIPGPPPMPVLGWRGSLLQMLNDPIRHMVDARRRYGEVVAVVRGGNPAMFTAIDDCPGSVWVFGAELNQQLLSDTDAFHMKPVVGRLYPTGTFGPRKATLARLGSGLFGVNGEEHRQQRRLIMPAFHKKRIEAYRDDMVAITQRALDRWQAGERIDVAREMMELTLLVAGKTLFGLDFSRDASNIGRRAQRWLKLLLNPAVVMAQVDLPGFPYHRALSLGMQIERDIRNTITLKQARGVDEGDVLSMLIRARDEEGVSLSEDEVVGHANIFFMAGHETSSNALTWTLFLLAQHPQVMRDVYDELDGVLHGDPPAVEQLDQLALLDRVIKESMRLLPPVTMSGRLLSEPVQVGPYELPVHTEVGFSHYVTHHDPETYSEPEKFNPDRWLHINPSAYEYMPFSAGKRMCIGAGFAMMEIKIVLATLLQRYRLQLQPNARIDRFVGITMSPKKGMPMLVHPQDRRFAHSRAEVRGNVREMVEL
jgi:cytochrome P450